MLAGDHVVRQTKRGKGRLYQNQLWRGFTYSRGLLLPRLIEKTMGKKIAILKHCGVYKQFICISRKSKDRQ